MKCKNIECLNETTGKRVYCSLTCRNVFVNKYLRNYNKLSDTFKQKKKEKEIDYLNDPKCCKECNCIIPYDKLNNNLVFCSGSCRSSFTNRNRDVSYQYKISEGIKRFISENGYFGCLKESTISDKECLNCKIMFKSKNRKFCCKDCRRKYEREKMDEYSKYKADCQFKFNLSDYPSEFNFSLITENGWYSPTNKNNNLNGVSRDHMYSISEGFKNSIDSYIISHPANCQLMIHNENISKNNKCSIIIEELMDKIEEWDFKYKK